MRDRQMDNWRRPFDNPYKTDLPGTEPTADIIRRLESQMSAAASNMVDAGKVTVAISDLRRVLTELERAR